MRYVNQLLDILDGRKTYIGALVVGLGAASRVLGWVDDEAFQAIEAFGLTVVTVGLRHAILKATPQSRR